MRIRSLRNQPCGALPFKPGPAGGSGQSVGAKGFASQNETAIAEGPRQPGTVPGMARTGVGIGAAVPWVRCPICDDGLAHRPVGRGAEPIAQPLAHEGDRRGLALT